MKEKNRNSKKSPNLLQIAPNRFTWLQMGPNKSKSIQMCLNLNLLFWHNVHHPQCVMRQLKEKKKNVAYSEQLVLLYVYDIRPKMVNRVKNGQKQSKTVQNCQTKSKMNKNFQNCQKQFSTQIYLHQNFYSTERINSSEPTSPNPPRKNTQIKAAFF